MTTSFKTAVKRPGDTSDYQPGAARKATVIQASVESGGKYYLSLNEGSVISAYSSIDAPLQVGDVVYVTQVQGGGWVISGTS